MISTKKKKAHPINAVKLVINNDITHLGTFTLFKDPKNNDDEENFVSYLNHW